MSKKVASLQERRDIYQEGKDIMKKAIEVEPISETVNTITTDKFEISLKYETFEQYRERISKNYPIKKSRIQNEQESSQSSGKTG